MTDPKPVGVDAGDAQLRLATGLAETDSVNMVADIVATWAPAAAGAAFSNLAIFDSTTNMVRVVHADSLAPVIAARWQEFSIDTPTPLCDAILTGTAVVLGCLDDYVGKYETLITDTATAGLQATASLPLTAAGGGTIGAVGFGWPEPQSFTDGQLVRLRLIAALTAQALERVTTPPRSVVAQGRAAARALQEVFLPSVPATTDSLQTAAAYLPANASPMGGDWFDVFPVEGGTCLVIGDVGGHGLRAASLMAELRSAIRGFAVDDPSPARVVTRANRLLCKLHPDATATIVVGVWDPVTSVWLRCNAGHPPVLRCRAGEFGFLAHDSPNAMLGSRIDWDYYEEAKHVRAGTTLVLYTDGLIEIRQQPVWEGMQALLRFVQGLDDLAPQPVVENLLLWRLNRGPCDDDICLLAVSLQ